ncbi:MAG: hypothetical protein OQL16_01730 [Gammaproteobacteria bacterium]|nr:hypothetical protein [Gammaproteobacteria bacterium]
MHAFIVILATAGGLVVGGLAGFFVPLLFFIAQNEPPGGPASAGWVFAIITLPVFSLLGAILFGGLAHKYLKKNATQRDESSSA